jgi:pre-mRNA cleavage complex 2 protein Pcf11
MLASMLQSGSGADLSALIASLEANKPIAAPAPGLSAVTSSDAFVPAVSIVKPGELPPLGSDFNPKKDLGELSKRREATIRALYFELPFQCSQTGRRFREQAHLDAHMDWLHVRRRRRKDGKVSRKWFVNVSAWLKGLQTMAEDGRADDVRATGGMDSVKGAGAKIDESDVSENVSVPVDDNQKECALSGEPFETFWNESEQEWHYRGAVVLDRAVGGAKKGSIVLARAVPKKKPAATKKTTANRTAAASVKTEPPDAGRRSARGTGAKVKAEDAPPTTSPPKRARRG